MLLPQSINAPAVETALDWVLDQPMYAKILVIALAFYVFSIGASKILRAWRK